MSTSLRLPAVFNIVTRPFRRVSSWAGVSSGHNERAGKRRKGRTGTGNRSLRRVVVPWAWAASKPPTDIGRTLRRVARRLGRKKAAMAVAHQIVGILDPVLMDGTCDDASRYDRHDARAEEREKKRALAALEHWGYTVTLSPVAAAANVPSPSLHHRR